MKNITQGHLIFAAVFVLVFLIGITYAYRKDLKRVGKQYRKVWLIILMILVIYFAIFFLNRIT